jgi:predicted Zn-dependent protease
MNAGGPDLALDEAERQSLAVLAHVFIRHGRVERALPILRALHRLFPGDPDVAKGLAYAALAAGDAEGALAAADAWRAADPGGRGGALMELLRSRALARLGREAEAQQALARLVAGDAAGGAAAPPPGGRRG